jgi:hypothetical protein
MRHLTSARSTARSIVAGALALLGPATTAQVTPPSATPAISTQAISTQANGARPEGLLQQLEDRQQKLRQQLAEPDQRSQFIAERMQQERRSNPDLARVLQIDAPTEQQLLTLLVERQLASDLRDGPYGRPLRRAGTDTAMTDFDALQQQAHEYDQHMRSLGKLLSAAQVDTYLEYLRTRPARVRAEQFNETLPPPIKLSNAQKDALVFVFADPQQRRWDQLTLNSPMLRRAVDAGDATPTQLSRGSRIFNVSLQERMAQRLEVENRELLPRLATILSPAQVKLYAQQRTQQVNSLRDQSRRMRRELALGPAELVGSLEATPRILTATTQLEIRLRINGTATHETLISTGGATVTLDGPEGLLVEAQPSLTADDTLAVELRFYEPGSSRRVLIGRETRTTSIGRAQELFVGSGLRTRRSLLLGRQAYLLDWSVIAQYR